MKSRPWIIGNNYCEVSQDTNICYVCTVFLTFDVAFSKGHANTLIADIEFAK